MLVLPVLLFHVATAAVMLVWSCGTCPYSTNVKTASKTLNFLDSFPIVLQYCTA
jgi:Flp pilus assembly protein TadB